MFSKVAALILSLGVVATYGAPAATSPAPVPVVTDPSVAASLMNQPTMVDRMKKLLTDGSGNLLTGDALRKAVIFDFNQQKPATGAKGGSILLTNVDNFPMLTGINIAGAMSFIGPCGLNIPHSHPRANEFFTVIQGQLETGWVMENGFNQEISVTLGTNQATVFPMGSIHYQQNPTCDPVTFVAGFDNNDPGRSDVVTNFLALDDDVVTASMDFMVDATTIDKWRAHLPVNLAAGVDSCLQACGLTSEESN